MPTSTENKVKFGIKNVHYAKATIAADGSATYGTPKAMPGAVSIALNPQGELTPFYADNIVYYISNSNSGYQGDLEMALVPDEFRKDVLGEAEDSNGVQYEDADAPAVNFALTFQFEGDKHATRHVLYNCTATRPALESTTKTETTEPQTETLAITSTSVYNAALDKNVVKAKARPAQAEQYNSWNTSIYQLTANGGT